MAQASVQVPVEKATLTNTPSYRLEKNKQGEITGMTLAVPIFSERNSFLVVHLPKSVVQDLIREATAKPESQRDAFVRRWVADNQQAIYEQYSSSGGMKRFDYSVVPVTGAKMSEVTPRRAEPEKPPVVTSTPVRVPEKEKKSAQAPAASSETIISEVKVVEPYEPKPRPKTTIVEPTEIVEPYPTKQQPKITSGPSAPVTGAGAAVAVAGPVSAPAPEHVFIPKLPREVRSGDGTTKAYEVWIDSGREANGIGATPVRQPIDLDIGNLGLGVKHIKIMLPLTLSQLKRSSIGATADTYYRVCSDIVRYVYYKEKQKNVSASDLRDTVANVKREVVKMPGAIKAQSSDVDVKEYLDR